MSIFGRNAVQCLGHFKTRYDLFEGVATDFNERTKNRSLDLAKPSNLLRIERGLPTPFVISLEGDIRMCRRGLALSTSYSPNTGRKE